MSSAKTWKRARGPDAARAAIALGAAGGAIAADSPAVADAIAAMLWTHGVAWLGPGI